MLLWTQRWTHNTFLVWFVYGIERSSWCCGQLTEVPEGWALFVPLLGVSKLLLFRYKSPHPQFHQSSQCRPKKNISNDKVHELRKAEKSLPAPNIYPLSHLFLWAKLFQASGRWEIPGQFVPNCDLLMFLPSGGHLEVVLIGKRTWWWHQVELRKWYLSAKQFSRSVFSHFSHIFFLFREEERGSWWVIFFLLPSKSPFPCVEMDIRTPHWYPFPLFCPYIYTSPYFEHMKTKPTLNKFINSAIFGLLFSIEKH